MVWSSASYRSFSLLFLAIIGLVGLSLAVLRRSRRFQEKGESI